MTHPFLEEFAGGWAEAMVRTSIQSTFLLGGVWLACRLPWRLPPTTRCWLWRLACLKLLVALFWVRPVDLPLLLPRQPDPAAYRTNGSAVGVAAGQPSPNTVPQSIGAHDSSFKRWTRPPATVTDPASGLSENPRRERSLALGFLLAWCLGVLACAVKVGREWREAIRLVAALPEATEGDLVRECDELCARIGLGRPRILLAPGLGGPMVLHAGGAALVLPAGMEANSETRLMLAHELTHLRRRDLEWGWVLTATRVIFFFHPLVWAASGEWRLAHEMAADEQAVRTTGASTGEYGRVLLRAARGASLPGARSAATFDLQIIDESVQSLRRRIGMLRQLDRQIPRAQLRRGSRVTAGMLAVGATFCLAPWRVTAQSVAPPESPTAPPASSPVKPTTDPEAPKPQAQSQTASGTQDQKPQQPPIPREVVPPAAARPASGSPSGATAGAATEGAPSLSAVPTVPAEAAKAWEDMLLLQATRYLRLTRAQIEQLHGVARLAGNRLTRLREQEEETLAELRRMALRQKNALAAGRNISLQEQANALIRRDTARRRHAEAEAGIVREVLPRVAKILTPAHVERAYLLELGEVPAGEAREPALLDPASGFVVGGEWLVGRTGQLASSQLRLMKAQQAIAEVEKQRQLFDDPKSQAVILTKEAAGKSGAQSPEELQKLLTTFERQLAIGALPPESLAVLAKVRDGFMERYAAQTLRVQEERQAAALAILAARRQLLDGAASPQEIESLVEPIVRRMFLSPNLEGVLAERSRGAR